MENTIIQYLNKTISPEDEKKLLSWLEESEDNRLQFIEVRRIWLTLEYREYNINKEVELAKLKDKIFETNTKKNRTNFRKVMYYAASGIAAAIVISILVLTFNPSHNSPESDILSFVNNTPLPSIEGDATKLVLSDNKVISLDGQESSIQYEDEQIKLSPSESISREESSNFNQLQVPAGKRSQITFSDGTKVWANAGTRLVYPVEFEKDKREIYVDGEIYLDVTRDETRPFVVKTSNLDIKVLGTKFNVTSYNSDKERRVVLVSGSVKVINRDKAKESLLSPSKMYEYIGDNITITDIDTELYISWVDGVYMFNKEPLKNVLTRLSKYYGVDIVCDNEAAVYLCSGKLNLRDDIQVVLSGLSNSMPISYKFTNNTHSINIIK